MASEVDMKFIENISEDPLIAPAMADAVKKWSAPDIEDEQGFSDQLVRYRHTLELRMLFIAACVVVIMATVGLAVTYGPLDIGFGETYDIIWRHITHNISNTGKDYIVIEVRSPRIVAGIIGGIGLAVCGVVMQSVLKNPLADPYTTGVSSGASFGATIAITSGMSLVNNTPTVLLAFVFSLLPTLAIVLMSKNSASTSPTAMIMFGIGLMYVFNALTTTLMLWSKPDDLAAIYRWQVGSLAKVTWDQIPYMLVVVAAGYIAMQFLADKINVLATGDESAKALGVDAQKMRVMMLAFTGLICAAVVSFTGVVGFVGLVTPHIVRIFIGADNRYLLPASAIFGGMLMIVADLVGRAAIPNATMPVGVVMAFIGGPMFIWLLLRKGDKAW